MRQPIGTALKLRRGIHILPNLFTTGSVFCGFYAFIAVSNEKFQVAAWAIVIAAVFDMLDGRIARLTKTTSAFGLQYDSIADVISFGMAPAFLVYTWVLRPFGRMGWMAAFLYLLCGALRLARFNVTKPDVKDNQFIGLPIPAAAVMTASIVIVFGNIVDTHPMLMAAVVYFLAFLMVSNIRYPSFKKLELKQRVTFTRFLFVVLIFYVFATLPQISLFIFCAIYTLLGPTRILYTIITSRTHTQPQEESPNDHKP